MKKKGTTDVQKAAANDKPENGKAEKAKVKNPVPRRITVPKATATTITSSGEFPPFGVWREAPEKGERLPALRELSNRPAKQDAASVWDEVLDEVGQPAP
jgi:hypothetical protein